MIKFSKTLALKPGLGHTTTYMVAMKKQTVEGLVEDSGARVVVFIEPNTSRSTLTGISISTNSIGMAGGRPNVMLSVLVEARLDGMTLLSAGTIHLSSTTHPNQVRFRISFSRGVNLAVALEVCSPS